MGASTSLRLTRQGQREGVRAQAAWHEVHSRLRQAIQYSEINPFKLAVVPSPHDLQPSPSGLGGPKSSRSVATYAHNAQRPSYTDMTRFFRRSNGKVHRTSATCDCHSDDSRRHEMQGKEWLIRRTEPFAAPQRPAGRASLDLRYLSQLPLSAPSLAIAGLGLAGHASNF
jgi:hypothetical protein